MPLRAVLFDVGGPIDTEIEYERLIDQHFVEAFAAEGAPVTLAQVTEASEQAVAAFAWNAYEAMSRVLAADRDDLGGRTLARVVARRAERDATRGGIEVRPGIAEVLGGLRRAGILLAVAANQPEERRVALAEAGVAGQFHHVGISGGAALHKPDPLFFRAICNALGVQPEHCIMVGDRIDNDIAPARVLGMLTVRFRTGRHAGQQPRSDLEAPHADVTTVPELRAALWSLLYA